jgi:uncharacterized membrane protein YjjP (DUF1212 family)
MSGTGDLEYQPAGTEGFADAAEVQRMLLELGVALTMTSDAVSEIQATLRGVAREYGFPHARISAFPTVLIVGLQEDKPAGIRTIDSFAQLRLDQASDVIRLARAAESAHVPPSDAMTKLRRMLNARPRFGLAANIASHAVLTVGLGLVIRPAPIDLWVYAALGAMVGALRSLAKRFGSSGYFLAVVSASLVSAVAFLAHGGNEAASLRLTIPPLVTFLPGALLSSTWRWARPSPEPAASSAACSSSLCWPSAS